MRCPGVVVASLLLAACPSSPPSSPDAELPPGDGTNEPGNGLTLRFPSRAPFPISANDARIEQLDLRATSVRAIGDAAPGDERTTRLDYRMRYDESDHPDAIHFEQAPVGMYSSVEIHVGSVGGERALEIRGTCTRDGQQVDLEIESSQAIELSLEVDQVLAPGGAASIELTFDAAALVAGIDWDAQPLDGNGDVVIDDTSPAMAQVLAGLRAGFADSSPP